MNRAILCFVASLFVFTSLASCKTLRATRSTCFSRIEATALSLAPVNNTKATSARLRRWTSVDDGMSLRTCFTCSIVGNDFGRRAVATRVSFSDRLKYSASE